MGRRSINTVQKLIALVVCIVILPGCALFVPTVKPCVDRPQPKIIYKVPGNKESGFDHAEPIHREEAIIYAESAKDAYQSALQAYGWLPNVLALILIPLGAATLGLGITGSNPKAVTELGLITGSGLALGGWFQNKPRVRIYNAGFQGITCLLQSTKSLRLANPALFKASVVGQDGLTMHRAAVAGLMEHLLPYLPADPNNPQDDRERAIQKLYDQAKRIYTDSEIIEKDGYKLYVAIEHAGEDLVQGVDQIISRVNAAVLETEPDVQKLNAVIGGLTVVKPSAIDAKGGKVPDEPKLSPDDKKPLQDELSRLNRALDERKRQFAMAKEQQDQKSQELKPQTVRPTTDDAEEFARRSRNAFAELKALLANENAIERLNLEENIWDQLVTEMNAVVKRASLIQAELNANKSVSVPDLANCMGVIDVGLTLKTVPDGDVEIIPTQTRRIAVSGGKPPYFSKFLTDPMPKDSIAVTPKMEGGSFYVELTSTQAASGGPYDLHIADILSLGKIMKVTVKTLIAAPSTPSTGTTPGGSQAARNYFVKVTYTTVGGETVPSPEASQAIPANRLLAVTSPIAVTGATGYNVYASTTSGMETKQNTTAIAIRTPWQEPTTGLIAGGPAPPTVNTATMP